MDIREKAFHTIGIDPGLSGAIACLDSQGTLVWLDDLPVVRWDKLAWIDGNALLGMILRNTQAPRRAFVERVNAMPKQGVASSFQFGAGFGSILGCLGAMAIPISLVRPGEWKKALRLAGKDKGAALDRARLLWPTADLRLKKHDGRAEALLIAAWGLHTRGEHNEAFLLREQPAKLNSPPL